jgi:hypothetical protein
MTTKLKYEGEVFNMSKMKKKMMYLTNRVAVALTNNSAEGFVDTGIKILISVVVGAALLAGLYALYGDTILPTLKTKIEGLFNYKG